MSCYTEDMNRRSWSVWLLKKCLGSGCVYGNYWMVFKETPENRACTNSVYQTLFLLPSMTCTCLAPMIMTSHHAQVHVMTTNNEPPACLGSASAMGNEESYCWGLRWCVKSYSYLLPLFAEQSMYSFNIVIFTRICTHFEFTISHL